LCAGFGCDDCLARSSVSRVGADGRRTVSLKRTAQGFIGWEVLDLVAVEQTQVDSFTEFVRGAETRLQTVLIARYGPDLGQESAAEALAYAWEHWDRVSEMENPVGYLYRVASSRVRRLRRRPSRLPEVEQQHWPWVEPGLPAALRELTNRQRTVVLMVHSFGYTHAETADVLGRGMAKLRFALEVADDG